MRRRSSALKTLRFVARVDGGAQSSSSVDEVRALWRFFFFFASRAGSSHTRSRLRAAVAAANLDRVRCFFFFRFLLLLRLSSDSVVEQLLSLLLWSTDEAEDSLEL